MRWSFAIVIFATGCVASTAEPVYAVRRSALVPHPQPPMRTGFPLDGDVRLSVTDSTVLVPVQPVETAGANAGLYVARHNIGGALRFRIGDAEIGLSGQGSLLRGAMPVAKDAARAPSYGAAVFGAQLAYSIEIDPRFRIGFEVSAAHAMISFFEQRRCIQNCVGAGYSEESGEHEVLISGWSVTPSLRQGRATFFGGITRVNHLTNSKLDIETATSQQFDDADEVRPGPTYTILGIGVEYAATRTLKLLGQVHQAISSDVVSYGPAFGIAFSLDLDFPNPDDARRSR